MPLGRLVVIAAVIGFLALLGYGLIQAREGTPGSRINTVGGLVAIRQRPMPELTMRLFDGGTFRLSEAEGPVLLNFWASWCPPCRDEAPVLEAAHRRGVKVVGVNLWDQEADARRFVAETGVTFPNGFDPGTLGVELGIRGIPETNVVDSNGQLVKRWIGPLSEEAIATLIAQ